MSFEEYEMKRERFIRATEPLCIAIGKADAVFFKGYLITNTGQCETLYHDGHDSLVKLYTDDIERIKEHYFPEGTIVVTSREERRRQN